MKKFKNLAIAIVSAMFLTVGLYSCSNDEVNNLEQQNIQNENLQNKPVRKSDAGYIYAQNFYSTDISLGRSIDLIDPDTNEGVTVTEVTVSGDSRARGYIVNKVENYDFLYFVDVDRINNVLTSYEAITGTLETFKNIQESPQYLPTNKFDFITYSPDAMNTTYGSGCGWFKRLWGTCTTYMPPSSIGNGNCTQQVNVVKYRFGEAVDNSGSYLYTGPCSGTK